MNSKLEHRLDSLEHELNERKQRRVKQLAQFGTTAPSIIAGGVFREAAIHSLALWSVTKDLIAELRAWAAASPSSEGDLQKQVAKVGLDMAVKSLEECAEVLGVSQLDDFIKLSIFIATKAAKLTGLDTPGMIAEFIAAIIEIKEKSGMQYADERTACKMLTEIELFMMTALSAGIYATAQVHALTCPPDISAVDFNDAGELVMKTSKAFVVEQVRWARNKLSVKATVSLFSFPEDGFWPDAQMFRENSAETTPAA